MIPRLPMSDVGILLAFSPPMRKPNPTRLLFAAWLCVACGGDPGDPGDPTAESRAKWAAECPADYVVEECVSGFVGLCTQTMVIGGVAARARETFPEARELEVSERPDPIEARFDEIDAIHTASDCHDVSESFDASYGYPTVYGAS